MYIDSDKIKVFPSSMRGTDANGNQYNPEARLTTEHNLTSMVNAGGKYGSFVISKDFVYDGTLNTKPLIICLRGYIFEIANAVETLDLNGVDPSTTLYADIKVQNKDVTLNSSSYALPTLIPYDTSSVILDRGNVFYGLSISTKRTATSLAILECVNDINGHHIVRVPKASKFIAVGDDIDMSNVENDCKFKHIQVDSLTRASVRSAIGEDNNRFPYGYFDTFKATNGTINNANIQDLKATNISANQGASLDITADSATIDSAEISTLTSSSIEVETVTANILSATDTFAVDTIEPTNLNTSKTLAITSDKVTMPSLSVSGKASINGECSAGSLKVGSATFNDVLSLGNYNLGYNIYHIDITFSFTQNVDGTNFVHTVHNYVPLITNSVLKENTPNLTSKIKESLMKMYGKHVGGNAVRATYAQVGYPQNTHNEFIDLYEINIENSTATFRASSLSSGAFFDKNVSPIMYNLIA